ncbi:FAD-binding oxidoreductase [Hyphomonas sp. FCG-A18]|uniref:FAD-binding oxidoreductase n=1 Tax=Hyphomonas sp. FCG-A18 TaxID=3080019 RepID=UPI002B291B8E|nr:FAD-binding oxidoreductase [Hyphomonas sp. FCG-A18]
MPDTAATLALPAAFEQAAKALLGPKGWHTDADLCEAAATPWRGTYSGRTPAVAMPASTQEASELIKLCNAHHVAITPQGGNTGLVDAGTPHGEITLNLRRMQAVRDTDPFNNSLTIEAGAPLVNAQQAADDADRLFPLSLGSQGTATIGGLISTNAGGVAVLRYGMMRDLILGLEVVLPNGEIWDGLSGLRKNNTGYDLKHLFAGAEGTLGIITAATLKLFPKVQRASSWISCESPDDIIKLLALVRKHAGDTVTSFEMIPANAIDMVCQEMPDTRDPNPSELPWRVLCEISMTREDHARALLESALEEAFEIGLAADAVIAESLSQANAFWAIRESIPLCKRAFGTSINHDVSVPVSRIPDFLIASEAAVKTIAPEAEIVAFGHVGDGNLHYSACEPADVETPSLGSKAKAIVEAVHACAMQHDGSISAEHGVGRLKRDELAAIRPKAATEAMIAIKRALDPNGILNPGRVISAD